MVICNFAVSPTGHRVRTPGHVHFFKGREKDSYEAVFAVVSRKLFKWLVFHHMATRWQQKLRIGRLYGRSLSILPRGQRSVLERIQSSVLTVNVKAKEIRALLCNIVTVIHSLWMNKEFLFNLKETFFRTKHI